MKSTGSGDLTRLVGTQQQPPEVLDVLGHDPSIVLGGEGEQLLVRHRAQSGTLSDGDDIVAPRKQRAGHRWWMHFVEQ